MEPLDNSVTIASARTLDPANPTQGSGPASAETSFDDVLARKTEATDSTGGQSLESPGVDKVEQPKAIEQVDSSRMVDRADTFARGIQDDQKRIDRMMSKLSRGAEISQGELLRMQATTYRYAQRVDLATKVVEKTANGVKQMMNTQV